MKLEDQVCSLELAKRLKELGVTQSAHFAWFDCPPLGWGVGHVPSWAPENYAAFTVAELGEMLRGCAFVPPKMLIKDLTIPHSEGGWFIDLPATGKRSYKRVHGYTEADARAKMLTHLIKNKLVTTKETIPND